MSQCFLCTTSEKRVKFMQLSIHSTTPKIQPTSHWLNVWFIELVCTSTIVYKRNKLPLLWST